MNIYHRMQASVLAMLTRYGQPMELIQAGVPTYDVATSSNVSVSPGTYTGTGLLLDFSEADPSISTIKGTEIQQGDKMLYLAVQGRLGGNCVMMPQPNTNDTVVWSNTPYNVMASTTLDPSGRKPVMHAAHVRGIPSSS